MKRLGLISLIAIMTVSCTEAVKKQQAFEIFVAGEYTLLNECPPKRIIEGHVIISRDSVQVDHSACSVKRWSIADESEFSMELQNCSSEGINMPSRTIKMKPTDNGHILSGWNESDLKMIRCEYT